MVDNSYTNDLLSGLDQAGAGQRARIDTAAQATLGSLIGRLFSTGLGTSSLVGSFTLGNEDRHQQALLDLSDKLIGQRLSAKEAGAGLGLQQYGIDTQASTAAESNATQRYGIQTNAATAAAQLAQERYQSDLNYRLGNRSLNNQLISGASGVGRPNYIGSQSGSYSLGNSVSYGPTYAGGFLRQ